MNKYKRYGIEDTVFILIYLLNRRINPIFQSYLRMENPAISQSSILTFNIININYSSGFVRL